MQVGFGSSFTKSTVGITFYLAINDVNTSTFSVLSF